MSVRVTWLMSAGEPVTDKKSETSNFNFKKNKPVH